MRWVAFLPLRGGSRAIPGKNIKCIAGRPLYSWCLDAAIDSACFGQIIVASDSPEIRDDVQCRYGTLVSVQERAAENCTETAATEMAMLDFQDRIDFDVICLIQATSPLTRAEDFQTARKLFETQQADSLVTVAPWKRFLWSADGRPLNYDPTQRPRRQDFAGSLVENGAFYFTRHQLLKDSACRLGGKITIYPMPAETLLEIDEPADWTTAEHLLINARPTGLAARLRSISALVLDVDGTMTDGGMYYSEHGEALKKFDTRDAHGLALLRETGVKLAVITTERSPAVAARMKKIGIKEYFDGVVDKLPVLKTLAKKWQIPLSQVAYVGDDRGDVQCLKNVGLALCPADAVAMVRQLVHYRCKCSGGAGAVREVCELIISHKQQSG